MGSWEGEYAKMPPGPTDLFSGFAENRAPHPLVPSYHIIIVPCVLPTASARPCKAQPLQWMSPHMLVWVSTAYAVDIHSRNYSPYLLVLCTSIDLLKPCVQLVSLRLLHCASNA
jgi:hypothetical protein